MRVFVWNQLTHEAQKECLRRPNLFSDRSIQESVQNIISDVRSRGDRALDEYSRKFDGVAFTKSKIDQTTILEAFHTIDPSLLAALKIAKENITTFHQAMRPKDFSIETMPGLRCDFMWRPLQTVGIYIPGGTAPLFSSVLMLAIPALLAGCERIVLLTPPQPNGVARSILAAAHLCGIKEIYALGGAHAIAAMAYGSETIPKVDKIFGPGNAYVTEAKQLVSHDPKGASIDMVAGPSEVLIIADEEANAEWIAADLLAQAEHDTEAQVILLTTDEKLIHQVKVDIERLLPRLSRQVVLKESLNNCRMVCVDTLETAVQISNLYAPEHLIINTRQAEALVPKIKNAGSIFLGRYSPESAGDYASGTNHVLPTYGYAKTNGGVSLYSFMKNMTCQSLTPNALKALSPTLTTMAETEGLDAHALAVQVRQEKMS